MDQGLDMQFNLAHLAVGLMAQGLDVQFNRTRYGLPGSDRVRHRPRGDASRKKKNPLETTRHHQREFAALPRASRSRAAAAMPSPRRAVNLRWSSLETEVEAAIAVEGGCGVDLAMVGRALGLDPATVRLNGYFVSRGRGHVSSAVTWRALLDFFAARGLPTGDAPAEPVAVHGKPAPPPPPPPVSGMRARFSTNRWFSNFDSCHYYCYEIERTIWLEVCELAGFVASIHVFA